MTRTILVIGSVTAAQYQKPRLELLREGIKPVIKRVSFDEFFMDPGFLIDRYAEPEQLAQFNDLKISEEVYCDLTVFFAELHVKSFGDFHIVVMDEHAWKNGGDANYDIKTALNETGAIRWIVRPNGQVEYAG